MAPTLRVAAAQISPVWLDKAATLEKINAYVEKAAKEVNQKIKKRIWMLA